MEKDPSFDEPIYYEKILLKFVLITIILPELYVNLKSFFLVKKGERLILR